MNKTLSDVNLFVAYKENYAYMILVQGTGEML